MPEVPVVYQSSDEDSRRWLNFPHRRGDIVISTRSKCGTTWMQMICALLVFQTPRLPAPLSHLSPWLDWLVVPQDKVYAQLSAQDHRRFIKTHTPLDGIPLDPRVTYIVVARHPLDMAVSLYHQGDNLDRDRIRRLTGQPQANPPASASRPPLREWLLSWIDRDVEARDELDFLPGVMWHLSDAWARRGEPNILLFHYDDLLTDLEGEMRRLAAHLGITVPEEIWPPLVEAATFDQMRTRADQLVPDPSGVLKKLQRLFPAGNVRIGPRAARRRGDGPLRRSHSTTGSARPAGVAPPRPRRCGSRKSKRCGNS